MGTVAAVVAVIGAAESARQTKRAKSRRKEAERIAGGRELAQEGQATRQQIRQERIRRAQIEASAEATGVGGSSGEAGALGALASTTAGNIAFRAGDTLAVQAQTQALSLAAESQQKGATVKGITSAVSSAASVFGGTQQPAPIEEREVVGTQPTVFGN